MLSEVINHSHRFKQKKRLSTPMKAVVAVPSGSPFAGYGVVRDFTYMSVGDPNTLPAKEVSGNAPSEFCAKVNTAILFGIQEETVW